MNNGNPVAVVVFHIARHYCQSIQPTPMIVRQTTWLLSLPSSAFLLVHVCVAYILKFNTDPPPLLDPAGDVVPGECSLDDDRRLLFVATRKDLATKNLLGRSAVV